MKYSLNEIGIIRKKLGLTQAELAKKANVSQSLIAKIEAKVIDPSYSKTVQIFETIERLTAEGSKKAKDIMNANIIFANPKDNIVTVIKKMKEHEISQIPVMENGIIGMVSEESILGIVQTGKNINELVVKDAMTDVPPIIPEESSLNTVTNLLLHNSLILVGKYGKIIGIITKADLLKNLE